MGLRDLLTGMIPVQSEPTTIYAECERATASTSSPIHIRRSETGLHPGGGAHSAALCGAEVSWGIRRVYLDDVLRERDERRGLQGYCSLCIEYVAVLVGEARS